MENRLQLQRPLVFFDIESTGTNALHDRIVELAVIKLFPDGTRQEAVRRVNPEMPIPAGASAVHGIYDKDVADAPVFRTIAANLANWLAGCDLAGYNIIKFDIPMLCAEFQRADVEFSLENRRLVDVFNIFCKLYPRNLSAAYKFFCDKDLEDAHTAIADTAATLEVLFGQLTKHPELGGTVPELAEYSASRDTDWIDREGRFKFSGGEAYVNFGRNSGRRLREISENDPGFLRWIIRSDFSEEVKNIARDALIGKFPAAPAGREG